MQLRPVVSCAVLAAGFRRSALFLLLPALAIGCHSPLARPGAAFSAAVAPVVSQSAAAYSAAVALNDKRNDYEAVVAYENKDASYNPRNAPELLSEQDIQARLAVLAALQMYAQSVAAITSGTDSKQLDDASKSVGGNLASLGNQLAPSIDNVLGIAAKSGSTVETTVTTVSGSTTTATTTTTTVPARPLTPSIRNGISTGIDALGQFLISRTIATDMPPIVEQMDPHVQALCTALDNDIGALEGLEERDYNRILDLEKQFILEDQQPDSHVDPIAHRAEIMQLPELARQQRAANEQLEALRQAIAKLAKAHHDLADAARSKNSESFKDKIGDLAATGSSLGNFYSSLPTKATTDN